MVEREQVNIKNFDARFAVETGLQWWHFLAEVIDADMVTGYRKNMIAKHKDWRLDEKGEGRFLRLMNQKSLDGRKLYVYLLKATSNGTKPLAATDKLLIISGNNTEAAKHRKAVTKAVRAWLAWMAPKVGNNKKATSTWEDERPGYRFAVAAPGPTREVVYEAEYPGGHLDWYSFDRVRRRSLGAKTSDLPADWESTRTDNVQPSPADFPGMPGERWWTFENRAVNLPATEVATLDLARLIFLEFSLISGNDWFVLPIDLPIGAVARVSRLVVTNTFGERTNVTPVSQNSNWRMYQVTDPNNAAPLLFLAPALGISQQSEALEEVRFIRDETANLVWAVEARVAGADGKHIDRASAWREAQAAREAPAVQDGDLAYQLATSVPGHWYPMVPRQETDGQGNVLRIVLERGRVQQAPGQLQEPALGERLHADTPLVIHAEEIGRAGLTIRRAYQGARWSDGGNHHWVGRRIVVGRGEGSAGLRFDQLK